MADRSPRKTRFTQGEVAKALRAAKAAGHNVGRVDIEPSGRIVLFIGDGQEVPPSPPQSSIDDELARILRTRQ